MIHSLILTFGLALSPLVVLGKDDFFQQGSVKLQSSVSGVTVRGLALQF